MNPLSPSLPSPDRSCGQDPRRIDPILREKYDVRGPRYTSYPPATHFRAVTAEDVFQRWQARNHLQPDPGLSLYLHIPYCRTRCLFCGCHTYVGRKTGMDGYVDALLRELRLATTQVSPERVVRQLAMGGGTPNFLEVDQLNRLLDALEQVFAFSPDAERSVEIDPRTATPEKLETFLQHGFNRFSLGIQDMTEAVLKHVRRDQALMQVEEVVGLLRQAGCPHINFDLIYGLPGQSLETASEVVQKVLHFRPSRIALYSYAHVPWIHPHQQVLEKAGLPGPDLKSQLFLHMMDGFLEAGYESIGMDHFALPEDPLAQALRAGSLRRTFMGYTTGRGLDVLAFGASAISSIGSAYSQNEKGLDAYLEAIAADRLPIHRGFLLTPDDELRRDLIISLFCNFQVDLRDLSAQHGVEASSYLEADLEKLAPLRADGLLTWDSDRITVSESGRFFIRNICMAFDRHLEADAGRQVYSRTV